MNLCSKQTAGEIFNKMDMDKQNAINFIDFHNNFKYSNNETILQEKPIQKMVK